MSQFEQWENCQKLGKSTSKAYSIESLGCSTVFKLHKYFPQGRNSLEDDKHISRPRMIRTEHKIEEIATLARANLSKTVDEVAEAGIGHGTCHAILSYYLNISCVTQHSVRHIMTQD
jgi:hypothetical protein